MKNFGFGCMRLPMNDGQVDLAQFSDMVDLFLREGFTYFDTAHGYLGGKSETALKAGLTSRYPREAYLLTNKLSNDFFTTEAEILPLFEKQLEACGVEYFDNYLMHAQNARFYEKYVACNAYKIAAELKAQGKVKHVGISFHDSPEVLDKILSEQPAVEVVQIQFNYADYDDPTVESKKCLDVCRKHGKPVIIMEPVKGGMLAELPQAAEDVFAALGGASPASYAIRYAASFEGVMMVLSGMSDLDQMKENASFMKDFTPLSSEEYEAVEKVRQVFKAQEIIPCTACRYCTDGCPQRIAIPDIFSCVNSKQKYKSYPVGFFYGMATHNGGKASDCVKCGKCEEACPQHLAIRDLLEAAAKELEG